MEQWTMFRWSVFYEMWMACDSVEEKAELWQAIMEYGLFGTEPPSKFKRDFVNIRFILERHKSISQKRSEAGKTWDSTKKSESMKWNQNAVKDWQKVWKQNKTEQIRTNETKQNEKEKEIEKEKEEEISMCDTHTATAEEKEIKIRQTTATIKAERIWKLVLKHWNDKLWRNELRNSELTQRSYALDGVDLEQIDWLIDRFKWFKDKIEERKLQGLFYFNLNQWVLADFMKYINKFEWDFDTVTWKLAKQDCVKQAIKELLKK